MRNIVLIFSILITLVSCSKNEKDNPTDNSINGTWQLIGRTANNVDGSPNDWEQVENGYKITFNEDFTYESEISPANCNEIDSSIYLIENESELNIIETTITCINPEVFFQSTHSYSFDKNGHLNLKPIEPGCPEGCTFKFRKIE
ncbi:hypothetical protein [Salegentibacter mishustinae]|jgi:hypothetical protein|uniref:Lipocalin-like domain-containing protein n=1 Tax=Salegentibacter mishustinae TaxID=270918 RepID=A0A0Q9Z3E8_9FLAO|nr:hypothetical protein [Salegentibacter mishustinae]KRG27389.1 hypothetical protein APR42_09890 [Salegentibacter mishustinae]PNW20552.1 hypothetical protein APB85_04480 [Salegentibacter mishustinae]PZX63361.1 lipocalin-like protein [Salegentibacter mishustinae]GGW93564.1 hypothetical protein GCM10008086_23420 [Salegentibacter mishustinae]|tara:strand:+ start:186 stop:620 length:435 start_codon:yes stop_codon:yes gene_type:complete